MKRTVLPRRRLRAVMGGLVFLVLMGCGPDDGRGGRSEQLETVPTVTVVAVPVLDVTGTEANGGIRFLSVSGASRLGNGVVVLADAFDHSVRFIGRSGEVLRVTGRAGTGPTEFGGPSWLGQCAPDSIFVWDAGQRNLAVLDTAGVIVRRSPFSYSTASIACTHTETLLVSMTPSGITRPTAGESRVYTSELWLADETAERTTLVAEFPLGDPRPLGTLTQFALTEDRIYVGTADSASIDVLDRTGASLGSIALGIEPRAPTQVHQEHAIRNMVAPMTSPDYRGQMTDELMKLPLPEHLPPYTDLLTDPERNLWVQLSAPGDSTTRFKVFNEQGLFVADVSLPVNMTVFEIGDDFILGKYEDSVGEQHVRIHDLVWR